MLLKFEEAVESKKAKEQPREREGGGERENNARIAFLEQRQQEMRNRERMERDTICVTVLAVFFYDINDENGVSR